MKMKMIVKKKKMLLVFMVLLLSAVAMQAQVRIGQNEAPRNGAILDLSNESGGYKGGLLLPKINIDDLGKIPQSFSNGPATRQDTLDLAGLIVWNTRRNFEGVYMWNGTDWKRMEGETPLSYPSCSAPPVGLLAGLYGTKDADGNLWIDIPSGLDARGAISPFNLTVTSDPLGSLTTVTDTYNGGVVFNPAHAWTTGPLSASPTVYDNLQAADMSSGTGAVTAADPWKTRQTVLTFSGESGCPPVPGDRTVTLNQTNYAIKPSVTSITFTNTNNNNVTIAANVNWKVKSIDDPYNIMTTTFSDGSLTAVTTGGANRSDNDKTTSGNYTVAGVNSATIKYQSAIITLEDTGSPKKASDKQIHCMSCLGSPDFSLVTKTATPDQTTAGDPSWNTGVTKAERVVRHLAKYVNDDPNQGTIYDEFLSADFGPAGRWMVTNLAAYQYDGIRHSTDDGTATTYTGTKRTIMGPVRDVLTHDNAVWSYPGTDGASDAIFLSDKSLGLLYTYDAVTAGKRGASGNTNIYAFASNNANANEETYEYLPEQIAGTTTVFPGSIGNNSTYIWRVQGICPSGWHIPSGRESAILFKEFMRNSPLYFELQAPINPTETIDGNDAQDKIKITTSYNNTIIWDEMVAAFFERCFKNGQSKSPWVGGPNFSGKSEYMHAGNSSGGFYEDWVLYWQNAHQREIVSIHPYNPTIPTYSMGNTAYQSLVRCVKD